MRGGLSMAIEKLKLWKEYKDNNNEDARQKLILHHLSLVKYQAGRVKMIVPDFVDAEDLESFGVIGLIDAVNKFDYKLGYKFTTYASRRIRGEIMDHLRKLDWLPHSLRKKGKLIKEKAEDIERKSGKKAGENEIAEALDMSVDKVKSVYQKIYSSQWISLYNEIEDGIIMDLIKEDSEKEPESRIHREEMLNTLTEAISRLKEKEKIVISLYYYDELTQQEIANILELSTARISQIHKKAVQGLRAYLGENEVQFF